MLVAARDHPTVMGVAALQPKDFVHHHLPRSDQCVRIAGVVVSTGNVDVDRRNRLGLV